MEDEKEGESGGEDLFHDLELRHISLKKELERVREEKTSLSAKNKALEETIEEMRGSAENSTSETFRHKMEIRERDAKIRELEQNVDKLSDQYKRKCEESDRLRDDVKLQADQLVAFQSRMRELQNSLSEAESQLLPAQYALNKLEREHDGQKQHMAWLEEEVSAKSRQIVEQRQDFAQQIEELTSQLSKSKSEAESRAEQVARLTDEAAVQEERVQEMAKQLRTLEAKECTQREEFLAELDASKRMTDLYKHHLEEATARVGELEEKEATLQERLAKQQQRYKENMSTQVQRAEEVLKRSEEDAKARIAELEQELAMERSNVDRPLSQASSQGQQTITHGLSSEQLGMSAADMLDKVVQAEKAVAEETRKRKECELYLDKILKDIEVKAPLISSQRRDYKRLLESHAQLSHRVDDLLSQCSQLKTKLAEAEKLKNVAIVESTSLENQNKDLARQLQHILKKSMGMSTPSKKSADTASGSDASGVISEYLVTFDDVEELQARNMQLLKVVRRLSGEQEEAASSSLHVVQVEDSEGSKKAISADDFADMEEALKAAVSELSGMRESRQRMEEMVSSLAQQRDIYRAMLEEVDATASASVREKVQGMSPQRQEITNGSPVGKASDSKQLLEEISSLQEHIKTLETRNSRLEQAEATLNEAVDKHREEISSLRSQLSSATSEARFQEQRVKSLESSLQISRGNEESLSKRRIEAESLLLSQQKEARRQQQALLELRESLRRAEETTRRAEVSAEVASASETRLQGQVSDLREELKRQSNLTESMGRIEASLASRMKEERQGLEQEVQSLTETMERNRKQYNENMLLSEQKIQTLEDELRISRSERDRRTEESSSLREELLRLQGTCAAAQERSSVLERQLTIAQDRLAAIQGASTADSILVQENEQKDEEIERSRREIEELKTKLESAETHVAQYRTISNSTESMLRELQKRSSDSKQALEKELSEAKKDLEAVRKELSEKRDQLMDSLKESESTRETLQGTIKKLEEDVKAAQLDKEGAESAAEQARNQAEVLRADAQRDQEAAKEAKANYERELSMHAKAASDLRAASEKLQSTQEELEQAQQKIADLSAQCLESDKRRQEQEVASARSLHSLKEDLASHKHTNDLLHSQVQSMSAQLSRLSSHELGPEDTCDDKPVDKDNAEVDVTLERSEVSELRKSTSELREVIRYMKREKDMTEAKLTLAETEKHRYSAQLTSVQKALDEARAELQRELSSKANPTRSEEEFAKLMSEISELNVVRESNAHLRFEFDQISKEKQALESKLQAALADIDPVRDQVRRLEGQVESLEAEKTAVAADAGYWKDRLHQLVSRYSDVDPEEHRLLQEKLTATEAKLTSMEEKLVTNEAELASCRQQLEQAKENSEENAQELAAAKATATRLETSNENFRGKLRELNSLRKDLLQQNAMLKSNLNNAKSAKATSAQEQKPQQQPVSTTGEESTAQMPLQKPTADGKPTPPVVVTSKTSASEDSNSGNKQAPTAAATATANAPASSTTANKGKLFQHRGEMKSLLLQRLSEAKNKQQAKSATSGEGSDKPSTAPPPPSSASEKPAEVGKAPKRGEKRKQEEDTTEATSEDKLNATATTTEGGGNDSNLSGKGRVDSTASKPATQNEGETVEAINKNQVKEVGEKEKPPVAKRTKVAPECVFFSSPAGCRFGESCRYVHTTTGTGTTTTTTGTTTTSGTGSSASLTTTGSTGNSTASTTIGTTGTIGNTTAVTTTGATGKTTATAPLTTTGTTATTDGGAVDSSGGEVEVVQSEISPLEKQKQTLPDEGNGNNSTTSTTVKDAPVAPVAVIPSQQAEGSGHVASTEEDPVTPQADDLKTREEKGSDEGAEQQPASDKAADVSSETVQEVPSELTNQSEEVEGEPDRPVEQAAISPWPKKPSTQQQQQQPSSFSLKPTSNTAGFSFGLLKGAKPATASKSTLGSTVTNKATTVTNKTVIPNPFSKMHAGKKTTPFSAPSKGESEGAAGMDVKEAQEEGSSARGKAMLDLTPEEKRKVRAQRFAAAKEAQAKKKRSLTAVEESTEEEAPGESPALKTSKVDPTTATATTTTNPGEEASNDDNEESI